MASKIAVRASALLLLACCAMMEAAESASKLHRETFRSPGFMQGPGDVVGKFFVVEMPKGHIAIRSLHEEVVGEDGTPIPLHETYIHHWVLVSYYVPEDATTEAEVRKRGIEVRNSGVCTHGTLSQLFGLGSENRRTNSTLPPPYGIVVGDPDSVPDGHKEVWVLNVHAIDTRGAAVVRECTECLCDAYNLSEGERAGEDEEEEERTIPAGYEGGLDCCLDGDHCALSPEIQQSNSKEDRSSSSNKRRTLFMEYTVTWVDMSDDVIPVKVYILDATDRRTTIDDEDESRGCQVEFTVDKCAEGASKCIHTAESVAFLPDEGDVIYAVAHQHLGGVGSTLYNEDGEEICSSFPIYGNGSEVANENGYIVGMTACHPEPGSVIVRAGEKLQLRSWYNNEERHTGVMGLFYLVVAEPQSRPGQPGFHLITTVLVAVTIVAAFVFIGMTIARQLRTRRGGPHYQLV